MDWFFSDTTRGVEASAVVYSTVETAKANNLNIYISELSALVYAVHVPQESSGNYGGYDALVRTGTERMQKVTC